ncbi:MAG: NlpC/P60 family protein [Chthonomonadales bacterium]
MEGRGVVIHNVCPMRAEPSGEAEQVSQAIFGETVRIVGQSGAYVRIQTPDAYEGWVLQKHLAPLSGGGAYPEASRAAAVASLFLPVLPQPSEGSERITLLTLGTLLEVVQPDAAPGYCSVKLPDGRIAYVAASGLTDPPAPAKDLGRSLVEAARKLIGVPYLWGGRTPFGMDCSGFVQRLYWLCGTTIPRDAHEQAASNAFEEVDLGDAQGGDLLFFGSGTGMDREGITHVGMCLGDGRFIHSAGAFGVIVTPMDDPGYRAMFRCARRMHAAAQKPAS